MDGPYWFFDWAQAQACAAEGAANRAARASVAHTPEGQCGPCGQPWRLEYAPAVAEPTRCTGAADCTAPLHVHGCYADVGQCDDPSDHWVAEPCS